jgi:chlorite dismutase
MIEVCGLLSRPGRKASSTRGALDGSGGGELAVAALGTNRAASAAATTAVRSIARTILRGRTVPARHFVKYTFLKVDPAWRRRAPEQRAQDKREFLAACEDFAAERLLRSFSLVGTRGDADLLLLSQATNLERIHEFHVVLAQSGLMAWCSTPYSYLAMTKPSEYSDESRLEVRPGHSRYLFVYPFVKTRAWYGLPAPERHRIMQEHIRLGREYPSIDLNTSYSFGLDDQEFVVAFETDDPASFLDLVQRLRTTESSSYTLRDTPTFTCIATSVERALNALDGEAVAAPAIA